MTVSRFPSSLSSPFHLHLWLPHVTNTQESTSPPVTGSLVLVGSVFSFVSQKLSPQAMVLAASAKSHSVLASAPPGLGQEYYSGSSGEVCGYYLSVESGNPGQRSYPNFSVQG